MKYCKNKREWWFPQNDWTYTFRNREFQVKDILEIFLREYLEELFKGYEKYCNLTEIQEHLQKSDKILKDKNNYIYSKRKMSRAKIEVIDTGNIGIYADFGSESEDEHEYDRQSIEKEDEEVRDFVKCHPMPSPDDVWKKVINRLKHDQGLNAMIIYSFVNFDIMKKMYENLTDKKVIVDCGKDLNRDGKWDAMAINQTLLALAIDELNDTDKPITSQIRIIEHWWDGIGKWKA